MIYKFENDDLPYFKESWEVYQCWLVFKMHEKCIFSIFPMIDHDANIFISESEEQRPRNIRLWWLCGCVWSRRNHNQLLMSQIQNKTSQIQMRNQPVTITEGNVSTTKFLCRQFKIVYITFISRNAHSLQRKLFLLLKTVERLQQAVNSLLYHLFTLLNKLIYLRSHHCSDAHIMIKSDKVIF